MLNRSECKKMWVWNDDLSPKIKRIIVESFIDGSCRAVCDTGECDFYSDVLYSTALWNHYEEIKEPKMRPMTRVEILGWQAHAVGWVERHNEDNIPRPAGYHHPRAILRDIKDFRRAPITESGEIGGWQKFEAPEDNDE